MCEPQTESRVKLENGRKTSLQCHDLGLSLRGATKLSGITLTLPPSGLTVVMGPNGAGKSLLLRVLHGLIEPSTGTFTWSGQRPGPEMTFAQSMVFQRPVLLRRTVAANLDFVLHARGQTDPTKRNEALEQVGLLEFAKAPARTLSGGEQQRLALARALLTDPDVLFLDEPTASLDPTATALIEGIVLHAAQKGTKVIFVTHDPGQARRLADDVVFLNRGQLACHANAADFFQDPGNDAARAFLAGELAL